MHLYLKDEVVLLMSTLQQNQKSKIWITKKIKDYRLYQ